MGNDLARDCRGGGGQVRATAAGGMFLQVKVKVKEEEYGENVTIKVEELKEEKEIRTD